MRGDVVKNHLELLVLTSLKHGPRHGYSIIRAIRDRSDGEFELLEGSLYPALHRLERNRLVTSNWSNVAGRKRRVYKLSQRGRAALEQQERDWRRFERAMKLVLDGV
jgi:PadR family transcriptional regulator